MRITVRYARMDVSGKHNDRNFDLNNAPHIDQNKVDENLYWTYNGETKKTFTQVEEEFYAAHFKDHIDYQNKKNDSNRLSSRNKTVNSYLKGKNTRPEDQILQIGNMESHASKEDLWACALEYQRKFNEMFGEHCKILDMALHMDEATPHVHVRRVWIGRDEGDNEYVNQTKALSEMGFQRPDETKKDGKYNNAKYSFSQVDKNLFHDICIEYGLEIDQIPEQKGLSHLSTLEYKEKKITQKLENGEKELERIKTQVNTLKEEKESLEAQMADTNKALDDMFIHIQNNKFFQDTYTREIEELKRKSKMEQRKETLRMISESFEPIYENIQGSNQIEYTILKAKVEAESFDRLDPDGRLKQQFIKEKGLNKEFRSYAKSAQKNEEVEKKNR